MRETFIEEPKQELTIEEAIRRAQDGDGDAFEYLYNSHCKRVYGICLRMLKDRSDAEDLTQQVFLRVFQKIGTFRGDSCFSTWLHRVTVNAVLMQLRKKRPQELHLDDQNSAAADPEGPREFRADDVSMTGTIDRLNLSRAIRKLPAGYKRLFLLHDVMGYEHGEIAELVGCSVGCSKSQVHKARKRLRNLLHPQPVQGDAELVSA